MPITLITSSGAPFLIPSLEYGHIGIGFVRDDETRTLHISAYATFAADQPDETDFLCAGWYLVPLGTRLAPGDIRLSGAQMDVRLAPPRNDTAPECERWLRPMSEQSRVHVLNALAAALSLPISVPHWLQGCVYHTGALMPQQKPITFRSINSRPLPLP